MKLLLIAAMLLLTACTKEPAKVVPIPTPVVAATTLPPAVVPVASVTPVIIEQPERTEKKVCHDVTVKGKVKSQCKVIKIHKKYDGTVVPKQVKK